MGRRSDYRDYGYTRAVWNGLYNLINNEIGLAALLGNLWAESGIVPYRCENDNNSTNFFNRSRIYTNSVDNGTVTREQFINSGLDGDTVHKGYGLAQWTYYTRKTGYYDAWKSGGYSSIGSIELALYYLSYELETSFSSTLEVLRNATVMRTASSYVLKNFEIMADTLGMDYNKLVLSKQVHEDVIHTVTEDDFGNGIVLENKFDSVDALITDKKGIPMVTLFADCVPLFFLDKKLGVAALAHSGWKGTVKRIGQKTIEKMKRDEKVKCNLTAAN